jgi:hypothetical protein
MEIINQTNSNIRERRGNIISIKPELDAIQN